jgi:glycosyltransferase involved in cell wall biosynthesis
MVTKRLNSDLFHKAIKSFIFQSYPEKELVIVSSHHTDKTLQKVYRQYRDLNLVIYEVPNNCPLGECRNISIDIADGEWVCQWDDDDLSHRDRLKFQLNETVSKKADVSILSSQYHVMPDGKVYMENRPQGSQAVHNGWCGTVLGKKSVLSGIYPKWDKIEEDTKGLSKLKDIHVITYKDTFYHYLYTYHGNNTWDEEHNKWMVKNNSVGVISNVEKDWLRTGFYIYDI